MTQLNFQVSVRHYTQLGRLAAYSAFLEYTIEQLIWQLLRVNQTRGQATTTHLSMMQKLIIVTALVDGASHLGDQQTTLLALLRQADDLNRTRNRYIHAVWSAAGDPKQRNVATILATAARGKVKTALVKVTPAEIEKTTNDIDQLTYDLQEILIKLIEG